MSTEEYYRELMNAEIDGVISEEEAAALAERLRTDPRARAYYEELRRTVRLLDEAGGTVPPAELRERILGAVGGGTASPRRREVPRGQPWRRSRQIPAFAAGVAAGLLIFAAIVYRPGPPQTPERSGGTIGLEEGAESSTETFETQFERAGVAGSVLASFDSVGTTVTLRLSSGAETTALFSFGTGFRFEEIRSGGGEPFQMEVDRESVLIVHHGDGEYRVRLRREKAGRGPVDLKIFADQELVARIPIERE